MGLKKHSPEVKINNSGVRPPQRKAKEPVKTPIRAVSFRWSALIAKWRPRSGKSLVEFLYHEIRYGGLSFRERLDRLLIRLLKTLPLFQSDFSIRRF